MPVPVNFGVKRERAVHASPMKSRGAGSGYHGPAGEAHHVEAVVTGQVVHLNRNFRAAVNPARSRENDRAQAKSLSVKRRSSYAPRHRDDV